MRPIPHIIAIGMSVICIMFERLSLSHHHSSDQRIAYDPNHMTDLYLGIYESTLTEGDKSCADCLGR